MRFYWTFESLPELEPLSREQRLVVLTACNRKISWAASAVASGLVWTSCMGLATLLGVAKGWAWWAAVMVSALVASWVATQVRTYQLRPVVLEYLEEHRQTTEA